MLITLQEKPALRLHPNDDVAIALVPLTRHRTIDIGHHPVRLNADVGPGHKLALRAIERSARCSSTTSLASMRARSCPYRRMSATHSKATAGPTAASAPAIRW